MKKETTTMKTKYCKDCVNFRTLYKRADYQLIMYKSGECFLQHTIIDRYCCCEKWEERKEQNTVSLSVLNRSVIDLEEIKILLLEEKERIERK